MSINPTYSSETRILLEECIYLKKVLVGLIEENLNMKNQLSEKLKQGFPEGLLENFELIQNRLLQNDSLFQTLEKECHDLAVLLDRNLSNDRFVNNVLKDMVLWLSERVSLGEESLRKLKKEFDTYFNEKT